MSFYVTQQNAQNAKSVINRDDLYPGWGEEGSQGTRGPVDTVPPLPARGPAHAGPAMAQAGKSWASQGRARAGQADRTAEPRRRVRVSRGPGKPGVQAEGAGCVLGCVAAGCPDRGGRKCWEGTGTSPGPSANRESHAPSGPSSFQNILCSLPLLTARGHTAAKRIWCQRQRRDFAERSHHHGGTGRSGASGVTRHHHCDRKGSAPVWGPVWKGGHVDPSPVT